MCRNNLPSFFFTICQINAENISYFQIIPVETIHKFLSFYFSDDLDVRNGNTFPETFNVEIYPRQILFRSTSVLVLHFFYLYTLNVNLTSIYLSVS